MPFLDRPICDNYEDNESARYGNQRNIELQESVSPEHDTSLAQGANRRLSSEQAVSHLESLEFSGDSTEIDGSPRIDLLGGDVVAVRLLGPEFEREYDVGSTEGGEDVAASLDHADGLQLKLVG